MTIGMWLDEWFKVYVDELSENTVRNYKDARRRISLAYPNLETLALSELRPVAFQKMINELGKNIPEALYATLGFCTIGSIKPQS